MYYRHIGPSSCPLEACRLRWSGQLLGGQLWKQEAKVPHGQPEPFNAEAHTPQEQVILRQGAACMLRLSPPSEGLVMILKLCLPQVDIHVLAAVAAWRAGLPEPQGCAVLRSVTLHWAEQVLRTLRLHGVLLSVPGWSPPMEGEAPPCSLTLSGLHKHRWCLKDTKNDRAQPPHPNSWCCPRTATLLQSESLSRGPSQANLCE